MRPIFRWFSIAIVFLVFSSSKLSAQITANPMSGCAPLVGVTFTGVSGATNPNWNFGDNTSSSLQNPIHTYSGPGSYTVTYTATVGGSPVSHTLNIQVFGKPTVNFSATSPVSGCAPLTVNFSSTSTGGGGTSIVQHNWTFGDGGVSAGNNANPSHTYTLPGEYDITLIVVDQNGCDSSLTLVDHVKVSGKPNPVITSNPSPASSCNPPLNVTFSGSNSSSNSPFTNALTYSWDFGNGNTSNVVNPPTQTYNATGSYQVKLIVTDDNNCSDSTFIPVNISNPVADFSVDDTVCMTAYFVDTASSIGNKFWYYGDGQFGQVDTHVYAAGGLYTVTLIVSAGSCADTMTKQIYVQDVIADFNFAPSYSCSMPQVINFTNTSVHGFTYLWVFDSLYTHYGLSTDSSTAFNPVLTIVNNDTNSYTVNIEDIFLQTKLYVTSAHGCVDSVIKTLIDTVFLPTARLQPDITEGCGPLTVTFSDSSRSKEPIVTRIYDFGDGTVINSNVTTINHTYTNPGVYYASMIIVNSAGCTDTSYQIMITVGAAPTPAFSLSPTSVCVNTPVQFTDLSTSNGTPIDTWHYATDNGFMMSSCYTDPNPVWSFNAATGSQSVTMTACSNGCCASITVPNAINVLGPLVEFHGKSHCDTPMTYTFTGTIQDADSWTWDMGDGNVFTNSSLSTISHTYANTGDYLVKLIGYNSTSGCLPDTFTQMVYVRQIKAEILMSDSIFCSGASQTFDASPSVGVYPFTNNGYVWLWGDNTPPTITSLPTDTHTFSPGNYVVKLVVRDRNGCRDTTTRNIQASSVSADFDPSQFAGCIPWSVNFTDQSTSDTTLVSWNWLFGDGGISSLQNPSHTYTNQIPNSFNVRLVATNALGCKDTIIKTLTPSKPIATFIPLTPLNICAGDSVRFQPTVQNHAAYRWNFGDGDSSAAIVPWHVYTTAGTYGVSLEVTDSIGCSKNYFLSATVKVQDYPQAGFFSSADTLSELCFPMQVLFTDTSTANIFLSRTWDLGNGSTTVPSTTVGTSYTQRGLYTVSLVISTTFGCRDTMVKTYDVTGPEADFELFPSVICKGDSITFNIKDTGYVETYHWDFGDGSDTIAISPVTHAFTHHPPNGQGTITLIVWSADSSCATTIIKPITVHQVVAGFDRNDETDVTDTAHCLGIADKFTNTSLNATNSYWDFGDGTVSTAVSPTHTYTSAGTYQVRVAITNAATGCVDTLIRPMTIFPLPVVTAEGGDTCRYSPLQLTSTGGSSYIWSPTDSLSDPNIANPIATPSVTTTYVVTVTDTNGCKGTASATAHIIQPPPTVNWDTAIVIGEDVILPYDIAPVSDYIFTWTPSDSLSCSNCPNPTVGPLINTTYTLQVQDIYGCFDRLSTFYVEILPVSSVDVPSAFTPNGDGVNDIVYVRGWGIKRLIEFSIYNRWGELVFTTDDLHTGWDGTYKGALQNIESYAYVVRVETYVDAQPLQKKGYIKLIR